MNQTTIIPGQSESLYRRLKPWLALLWIGFIAAAVVMLCGCAAVLPSKRSDNAGVKTAEGIQADVQGTTRKSIKGQKTPVMPQPNVTVNGSSNTLSFSQPIAAPPLVSGQSAPYEETTEVTTSTVTKATSSEEAKASHQTTVPMWVNIAGFGVAILIVIFAFNKARQSSVAMNAAFTVGDAALKRVIESLRFHAQTSTDASEIAKLNAHIATAEAERGKFNAT